MTTPADADAARLVPATTSRDPWQAKRAAIQAACQARDVARLRALAVAAAGLLDDDLRRQAWPLLLGSSDVVVEPLPDRHRDEDQVQLDVDRSFIYYPHDLSPRELDRRKAELSALIVQVLRRHPHLCYFQGYHDICQVVLLVLAPPQQYDAVARLSLLRIRDFMLPTLSPALAQLQLLPAILRAAHPALHAHLAHTQPYFALAGTLTMYAHDVQSYGDIARLFDALLARDAVFSLYVFARIVLNRADELFDTPADEPEILHSILSKLPHPLDLDTLVADAVALCAAHPPESLPPWRAVSPASVLKTTRLPQADATAQSLRDGDRFFDVQVRELRWADRRAAAMALLYKYRRPAGAVGAALLVAALSYYLRRAEPARLWTLLREWIKQGD